MRILHLLGSGAHACFVLFIIWFVGGLIHLTYHYVLEWIARKIWLAQNPKQKGDEDDN